MIHSLSPKNVYGLAVNGVIMVTCVRLLVSIGIDWVRFGFEKMAFLCLRQMQLVKPLVFLSSIFHDQSTSKKIDMLLEWKFVLSTKQLSYYRHC